MSGLVEQAPAALERLLATHPHTLLIADAGDSLAAASRARWPERVLDCAGAPTRVLAADGAALGAKTAVVLLDRAGDAPLVSAGGLTAAAVLVTVRADEAAASALPVLQAAWPADLPALLCAAVGADRPTLVRLHTRAVDAAPEEPLAEGLPAVGRLRRLRGQGPTVLVAAGAAVPLAVRVARMLDGRGVGTLALEAVTVSPASAVDLTACDETVYLAVPRMSAGPPLSEVTTLAELEARAELRAVAAASDARAVMDAVLAELPLAGAAATGARRQAGQPQRPPRRG